MGNYRFVKHNTKEYCYQISSFLFYCMIFLYSVGLWWVISQICKRWNSLYVYMKMIYTDTERLGLPCIASLTCLFWSLKNSPLFSITCSSVNWAYGCSLHRVRISHRVTPNAHTSLAMVNLPCRNRHGQTDASLRRRYIWVHQSYQKDALPGHPADGEHSSSLYAVVISTIQVSAHAKVRDLDGVICAH